MSAQPRATRRPMPVGRNERKPGRAQTPTFLAIDNFPFGEGDIYVADTADNVVTKFNSSGEVISGWGVDGQKDGSDDPRLPKFGPIFGLAVGGSCADPDRPRKPEPAAETAPYTWAGGATATTCASTRRAANGSSTPSRSRPG